MEKPWRVGGAGELLGGTGGWAAGGQRRRGRVGRREKWLYFSYTSYNEGQEVNMPPVTLFRIHLLLGYVACLLCFGTYFLPKLRSMGRFEAHRVIATVHSFRFFGLVFILPGVVGPNLPAGFATFAAYGDFATGLLALLALLTARIRRITSKIRG